MYRYFLGKGVLMTYNKKVASDLLEGMTSYEVYHNEKIRHIYVHSAILPLIVPYLRTDCLVSAATIIDINQAIIDQDSSYNPFKEEKTLFQKFKAFLGL